MREVPDLIQRLHEESDRIEASPLDLRGRKRAVREHNRRMDARWAALTELASSPEGRAALEALLRESTSMSLRIATANLVMRWDGFLARDVLEEIVTRGGGHVVRPMTMTRALEAPYEVRSAALSLLNLNRPSKP